MRSDMVKYAQTLPASHARAQCYNIANWDFDAGETISDRLIRDHSSINGIYRAAQLIHDAGHAEYVPHKKKNYWGTFKFDDGSSI